MKKVICDVEANALENPTHIWCVVCKDIQSGEVIVFKCKEGKATQELRDYLTSVDVYIGHNFLGYDLGVLNSLVFQYDHITYDQVIDTLILSRLFEFKRPGHSLNQYGIEFGIKKPLDVSFDIFTDELCDRCVIDVEINHKVYSRYEHFLRSDNWVDALRTEHYIQFLCVSALHKNGFGFNLKKALELKKDISILRDFLGSNLKKAFPPRSKLIREITPKETKHGTLSLTDFRWLGPNPDLSSFSAGVSFSRIVWLEFNPGSPRQVVERLNEAGWKPTEKTKGHLDFLKSRVKDEDKKRYYSTYGWAITEDNLATLPETAPEAARKLTEWILLNSRVSDLDEWINLCTGSADDPRIHGTIVGLGAWTQRCSHQKPNTANITKPKVEKIDGKEVIIRGRRGGWSPELRSLWQSAPRRWLVGVDAEGIQMRVFAHYVNSKELIKQVTEGDIHALNARTLGAVCRSRNAAKTFIYAWLLGAGVGKCSQILECALSEAREAVENFIEYYPGLKLLKQRDIPRDAFRGYFIGFDKRAVSCDSEHKMLGGYLQNGESVIMKRAVQIWYPRLIKERVPFWWVNFVHDEWQTESVDFETCKYIGEIQCASIQQAGEELGLNCPMAGIMLNKNRELSIGKNWLETH